MLALLIYLLVPAVGVVLLRIAYRVHALRDYRYIKDTIPMVILRAWMLRQLKKRPS